MTTQAHQFLGEAMKLPFAEREELAIRLMEPTEAEAAMIKAAWLEEVEHRAARSDRGETTATPIEEAWPRIAGEAWPRDSAADA